MTGFKPRISGVGSGCPLCKYSEKRKMRPGYGPFVKKSFQVSFTDGLDLAIIIIVSLFLRLRAHSLSCLFNRFNKAAQ